MWESFNYNLTGDLDVCMNPYSKDAYGNYRIVDNNHKIKNKKINNHKYRVDDIGIWLIDDYTGNSGSLALCKIKQLLNDTTSITPQYLLEILDGPYSGNVFCTGEEKAIEDIDPTPYLPKEYLPDDYTSNKTSEFKCDIDDLKMDINDLRTDVNSLLENQCKIEGDLRVAKQPELGISIDDTVTSDLRGIKESGARLDCTVNYCVDKIDTIQEELNEVDNKAKQASKLSKLSLLGNLAKFL
jgi:hypothetical protein